MKFEEASTATKREKLMSIKKNFTDAEIHDIFRRISRTSGKKIANAIVVLLNSKDSENLNISSKSDC